MATSQQMQLRYCAKNILAMIQLSHLVFWIWSASWSIKRVAETERVKHRVTSKMAHNCGQLSSPQEPLQGIPPPQHWYRDQSL
jgi:hypothetical protein